MNIQKTNTVAELIEAIKTNEEVSIVGLGKFTVVSRPERTGRNPLTNEQMTFKASKSVKFKASATLKGSL